MNGRLTKLIRRGLKDNRGIRQRAAERKLRKTYARGSGKVKARIREEIRDLQ